MMMKRILFCLCLALLGGMIAAPFAEAAYPDKPITVIVPLPPGGNADILARALVPSLEESLGVKVVVTPQPGAGMATGTFKFIGSKPDGYTLLLSPPSLFTIRSHQEGFRLKRDDVIFLNTIVTAQHTVSVSREQPSFKSFQELIDAAKKNPGQVSMAITGTAGIQAFLSAKISKDFGVEFKKVAYDGGPPSVAAAIGGHVQCILTDNYNMALKPLVVTNPSKGEFYAGAPTFAELGHPECAFSLRYMIMALKGTPQPVMQKLSAAIKTAVASEHYGNTVSKMNLRPTFETTDETTAAVHREWQMAKDLIDSGHFSLAPRK